MNQQNTNDVVKFLARFFEIIAGLICIGTVVFFIKGIMGSTEDLVNAFWFAVIGGIFMVSVVEARKRMKLDGMTVEERARNAIGRGPNRGRESLPVGMTGSAFYVQITGRGLVYEEEGGDIFFTITGGRRNKTDIYHVWNADGKKMANILARRGRETVAELPGEDKIQLLGKIATNKEYNVVGLDYLYEADSMNDRWLIKEYNGDVVATVEGQLLLEDGTRSMTCTEVHIMPEKENNIYIVMLAIMATVSKATDMYMVRDEYGMRDRVSYKNGAIKVEPSKGHLYNK